MAIIYYYRCLACSSRAQPFFAPSRPVYPRAPQYFNRAVFPPARTESQAFLLAFATGCSRLPPEGSDAVGLVVDAGASGHADSWLPTSSTCSFTFHLPRYSSLQVRRSRRSRRSSNKGDHWDHWDRSMLLSSMLKDGERAGIAAAACMHCGAPRWPLFCAGTAAALDKA